MKWFMCFHAILVLLSGFLLADTENNTCVPCHRRTIPGIIQDWEESTHARKGIGCLDCHKAEKGIPGAFKHGGDYLSLIVSSGVCGGCHDNEYLQMRQSAHARAAHYQNNENRDARVILWCSSCHGNRIGWSDRGRINEQTWPDRGIGTIFPDGSEGSCTACHPRHTFSVESARNPEACLGCHSSRRDSHFPLNHRFDVLSYGCAECHLCSSMTHVSTHDPGTRLAWSSGPEGPTRLTRVYLENNRVEYVNEEEIPESGSGFRGAKVLRTDSWTDRRGRMKQVCSGCHMDVALKSYFARYDQVMNDGSETGFPVRSCEWDRFIRWHPDGTDQDFFRAMVLRGEQKREVPPDHK